MAAYLIQGRAWVRTVDDYRKIANPLVELVSTAVAGDINALSTIPTRFSTAELQVRGTSEPASSQYNATRGVRNVILIVMESVGADYVIGSRAMEVIPELTTARRTGITFENFYAHTPMSTKSLFSISARGTHFFLMRRKLLRVKNTPLATLSGVLKEAGYRTGLFMSGDLRFQSVDNFLVGRGFDILSDMTSIPCSTPTFAGSTTAWPNLDSVDDLCTAAALSKWIGSGKGKSLLGMNTHWPYFSRDEQLEISNEKLHLNRYLNALVRVTRRSASFLSTLANRAFGTIRSWLWLATTAKRLANTEAMCMGIAFSRRRCTSHCYC